eukprot:gene30487-34414_t
MTSFVHVDQPTVHPGVQRAEVLFGHLKAARGGSSARPLILLLKDNINEMIRNLKETTQKNAQQDWLKTNLARFTRLLQGQRDLQAVTKLILSELAPLVSAHHGVFYMMDSQESDARLRMTASLQRATGGRALYNVITGGGGPAQLWWGDSASHDDRYQRTTEFLDVVRGVWQGGPFSYQGKFYQLEHGGLPDPLSKEEFPEIYFSGSSDAALASASRHADYYLTWLEPFAALREKFRRVKERTDLLGRKIKCAVRVDIVARATEEEAWDEVRKGFERVDAETLKQFLAPQGDSVGAARQRANLPTTLNSYRDLIIEPNVWSGFNLLRGGQTQGIVG